MHEDTVRREVTRMLRYVYNLWPEHWPDIPGVKKSGRPDIVVMNPCGPGYYIEVKKIDLLREKSFSFAEINPSQRRWLNDWEEVRRNGSWFAVGTVNCRNRAIWLIPWITWLRVEVQVGEECAGYLPLALTKGERHCLAERNLSFESLLAWYKLAGSPATGWKMSPYLEELFYDRISVADSE